MTRRTARNWTFLTATLAALVAPALAQDVNDPAKLKERITALEKENADLKAQLAAIEFDKLGIGLAMDGPKDGEKSARVSLMKTWNGDVATLDKLKGLANLKSVYVDNPKFNDDAAAKLKDLQGVTSLTIMSPALTDKALESIKAMPNLELLFLTSSKITDAGLAHLKDLKNLKELSLSKTEVTDAGLEQLKPVEKLSTIYLVGTKVTDEALAKLKEAKPQARVVK